MPVKNLYFKNLPIEGKVISWRLNAKLLKDVNTFKCSVWISPDEV